MKYILNFIFLTFSFSVTANIEKSIYLNCGNCYTVNDLATAAEYNFHTKYINDVNQNYYYTIVNDAAQAAAFVDIQRRYDNREPGVPPIDVVQIKVLTLESDLYSDYLLSQYVLRNDSDTVQFSSFGILNYGSPKIKEVNIDGSIHDASGGVSAFRGEISAALGSNNAPYQWPN